MLNSRGLFGLGIELHKKAVIFASNSDLDGINEGDADLMDRLAQQWNEMGIEAYRVMLPERTAPHVRKFPYIRVLDGEGASARVNQLIQLINDPKYRGKSKILYVGSRIDTLDNNGNVSGSGGFFTRAVLEQLKAKCNVKIVICCLELKFFQRSMEHLPKLAWMTENHLQLADGVHFLTRRDQEFFETEYANQVKRGVIVAPKEWTVPYLESRVAFEAKAKTELSVVFQTSANVEGYKQIQGSILGFLDYPLRVAGGYKVVINENSTALALQLSRPWDVNAQPQVRDFVSGISTSDPFASCGYREPSLHDLMQRPSNVLCYGLIRGDKGIDSALLLVSQFSNDEAKKYKRTAAMVPAQILESEFKVTNKVYIVGRYMKPAPGQNGILPMMFEQLFGKVAKQHDVYKHYWPRIQGSSTTEEANTLGQELFDEMRKSYRTQRKSLRGKGARIPNYEFVEMRFNLSLPQLCDIATRCRFAIKLDEKGVAENSSTIMSNMAMYLPTIAQFGRLTPKEFMRGPYAGAFIMLPSSETFVEPKTFKFRPSTLKGSDYAEISRVVTYDDSVEQKEARVSVVVVNEGVAASSKKVVLPRPMKAASPATPAAAASNKPVKGDPKRKTDRAAAPIASKKSVGKSKQDVRPAAVAVPAAKIPVVSYRERLDAVLKLKNDISAHTVAKQLVAKLFMQVLTSNVLVAKNKARYMDVIFRYGSYSIICIHVPRPMVEKVFFQTGSNSLEYRGFAQGIDPSVMSFVMRQVEKFAPQPLEVKNQQAKVVLLEAETASAEQNDLVAEVESEEKIDFAALMQGVHHTSAALGRGPTLVSMHAPSEGAAVPVAAQQGSSMALVSQIGAFGVRQQPQMPLVIQDMAITSSCSA